MSSLPLPLSCHEIDPPTKIGRRGSGTNQPSSLAGHKLVMEDLGSRETVITVDTRQFSDKVPLTEFHLCRYEECHSGKKPADPESPLDPVKTRALYTLLVLVAFWATVYITLTHLGVL